MVVFTRASPLKFINPSGDVFFFKNKIEINNTANNIKNNQKGVNFIVDILYFICRKYM